MFQTPPGSDVEEEVPSATFPYTTFLYNNVAKPNNFSVQFVRVLLEQHGQRRPLIFASVPDV